MKVTEIVYDLTAWIHGGEKKKVSEDQEVTLKEFKAENITPVDGAFYPFHAFDALEVATSTTEKEVDDDMCSDGEEPTPPTPTDPPTFTGVEDVTIAFDTNFNPREGVVATDALGRSIAYEISGNIDTDVPGDYTLTYTATDEWGHTTTESRVVTVANPTTPPVFSGVGAINSNQGIDIDLEAGVTATDAQGKEVEFSFTPQTLDKCDVGSYAVTYTATDEWGNEGTATRTVNVLAIADPTISGLTELTVYVNEEFDPLDGVTGRDGNGKTVAVTYEEPTSLGGGTT